MEGGPDQGFGPAHRPGHLDVEAAGGHRLHRQTGAADPRLDGRHRRSRRRIGGAELGRTEELPERRRCPGWTAPEFPPPGPIRRAAVAGPRSPPAPTVLTGPGRWPAPRKKDGCSTSALVALGAAAADLGESETGDQRRRRADRSPVSDRAGVFACACRRPLPRSPPRNSSLTSITAPPLIVNKTERLLGLMRSTAAQLRHHHRDAYESNETVDVLLVRWRAGVDFEGRRCAWGPPRVISRCPGGQ